MRPFVSRYTLRTGVRGELHLLADSTCAALLQVLDLFGAELLAVSARPQR